MTDLDPADIDQSPILKRRLHEVRQMRLDSKKISTQRAASSPHLFTEIRQPDTNYICIPSVTSETRRFVTAAYLPTDVIASNLVFTATDHDGYLFGLVSSSMFIVWLRVIGGKLESRLRFSNTVVWNNFPLPPTITQAQRDAIIEAGKGVIAARELHPDRSLAEHYNPLAMSPALLKAHRELDAVVDRAFGARRTLDTDEQRIEILLKQYLALTEKDKMVLPKTTRRRR